MRMPIRWIGLRDGERPAADAGLDAHTSFFDVVNLVAGVLPWGAANEAVDGDAIVARHPTSAATRERQRFIGDRVTRLGWQGAALHFIDPIEIDAATQRPKRPLRSKQNIGLRAGKVVNRYKMGKHFQLRIEEDSFHYERKTPNIEREQNLDGIYVIRTNVNKEVLSSQQVVTSYKSLSGVERAFRSLKTVDLQVRPIHHRLPDRVRAHILLCMLAYYVEWHMRQLLAPILFDDDDKPQAQAARASIVDNDTGDTLARP